MRVLANCRTLCVSLAAALAAFWLWALRAAACAPAASRPGDVVRFEAFLLIAMPYLLLEEVDFSRGRPSG
jgi:hypothetical protein